MTMFLYGTLAGVICGGFVGCLAMALVTANRFEDEGTGTEAIRSPLDRGWAYPRDEARIWTQYEGDGG